MRETRTFEITFDAVNNVPNIGPAALLVMLNDAYPGVDIKVGQVYLQPGIHDALKSQMANARSL